MKSSLRLLLCFSLYAAALAACSKDEAAAPPTATKGGKTLCVANQTVYCRCGPETGNAVGLEGFQTCARDGKSFGECGPCIAEDQVDPPDVPPVACGNNFREGSEECDDGNQIDTDGCTHFCKYAVCGDKFVQAGKEECDDGNTTPGDGCSPACSTETADPCKDAGKECPTTGLGECRKGTFACQSNKLVCVAEKTAAAKDTCGNGLDDDCNGKVDDNNCPCSHDMCTEGVGLASGCTFESDKEGKNKACHDIVCGEDAYCCDNDWDDTCVKAVQLFCGRLSCSASKGACSHTLCTVGDALTPDCDKGNGTAAVTSCVKKICEVDGTCCTEKWDQPCVDRVISVCAKKCDQ